MTQAPKKLAKSIRQLEQLAQQPLSPERERALAELIKALQAFILTDELNEVRLEKEKLLAIEHQYRELFNATYDGIFLVDAEDGRILEANDQACHLVGYSHEEMLQLTATDLHPYELPKFRDFVENVTRHGRWESYELACRAKWGELIPVQLSASAVTYDGRPCVLVLVHDLRTHRLAEIGEAVGKIGHDLRNILATTHLVSESLAASEDPMVQRALPRLLHSVDRAINLCVDTLAPRHVLRPPVRRTRFQLRQVVEDVAATVGMAAHKNLAWRNEVPEEFLVDADPDQLFRVVLNLVRNVCNAIEEGECEIRITSRRKNGQVIIDLADTGPGLPLAVRERLFQPFASGSHGGGTGLGLVIAHELMRGHGGDIHLVSTSSDGTIFRLELPASHPMSG